MAKDAKGHGSEKRGTSLPAHQSSTRMIPKLASAQQAEQPVVPPVVVYHGTIDTLADTIRKEGLRVTPGGHHFDSDVYGGERGQSVFVTTDGRKAYDYALSHAQAESWKQYKPINPVVFKVEVPQENWKNFQQDKLEQNSRYMRGSIPAGWIKGAYTLSEDGKRLVPAK